MFKNKILLIAILLVGLIAISTVNAEEINNETSDLVNEKINDSIIESSNDDYVSDSSDGTFTDLANEIANAEGELNLTRNYIYSDGDSRYKNDGIKINKSLTVNGNGFIINGNNQARSFIISCGDVLLKNIKFTSCYCYNYGGSVYWEGINGTLFNCTFVNCYSGRNIGGSVFLAWKQW